MGPSIQIGPFTIEEKIGSGAMGEVWRASHGPQGLSVALKIITPSYASREAYRRRFYNEIRAAAALHHPGIVQVYDYGTVDTDMVPGDAVEVPIGAPYFAMELTPGGSIEERAPQLRWSELRSILIDLLRALSHAHARGVIHRDLKPSNVLLGETDAGRRFKISDFGLAFDPSRASNEDLDENGTVGTPPYMAPEQFQNRWRDYGPWTDLYGLGCLAWRLTTGSPPYERDRLYEVASAHMSEPLPDYEPNMEVPSGFGSWLARLLEKHPLERFRRAADALWVLLQMPDDPSASGETAAVDDTFTSTPSTNETAPLEPLAEGETTTPRHDAVMPTVPSSYDDDLECAAPRSIEPTRRAPPPLPGDWTQRRPPPLDAPRMSVGLELFTLREFPTVGRVDERDTLWESLRTVVDEERAQIVFIRGDAGVGKTRLAQWLREQAEALGAATGLVAPHGRRQSTGGGLPDMLRRALGVHELTRRRASKRIERWYRARGVNEAYEWHAMADLVTGSPGYGHSRGGSDDDPSSNLAVEDTIPLGDGQEADDETQPDYRTHSGGAASLSSAHEVRALIRRFLEAAAKERPVVVHLDDIHWGLETLHFLRTFFESRQSQNVPVLFVATVREDAVASRPLEGRLVEELSNRDASRTIELGPMSETEQRLLVEELLYLAPDAANRVVDRAEGSPLYAVELVRDWVDRGLLEPSEEGFRLRSGVDPDIPDNLYEIWKGRLDDITADEPSEVEVALQIGATLGMEFDETEWRAACERANVRFPIRVIEDLLRRNLFREKDNVWRFAHSMLRRTLVRDARDAGRWRQLNAVCAAVVAEHPEGNEERLAEFHLAAEQQRQALEPLLDAVESYDLRLHHQEAARLFEDARECRDAVTIDDLEVEATYQLQRGRVVFTAERDPEEADEAFSEVLRLAREIGDHVLRARALVERSSVYQQQQRYARGVELARQARTLLGEDDRSLVAARAAFQLAEALRRIGDADAARTAFDKAYGVARGQHPTERLKILVQWTNLEKNASNLREAETLAREALRISERVSSPGTKARVYNALGDISRLQGDVSDAANWYREAERLTALADDPSLFHTYLGRVQVELERDAYDRALRLLSQIRQRTEDEEHTWFRVARLSLDLQAAAGADQWERADRTGQSLEQEIQSVPPAIPGAARAVRQAALLAADADRPHRARDLARVAESIWSEHDAEFLEELRNRGIDMSGS